MGTQVQDDVVDRASDTSHELRLAGRRKLVMQAAHRPPPITARLIRLDGCESDAMVREFGHAEGARQEASIVVARFGLDEEGTGNGRWQESHATATPAGRATRGRKLSSTSPAAIKRWRWARRTSPSVDLSCRRAKHSTSSWMPKRRSWRQENSGSTVWILSNLVR